MRLGVSHETLETIRAKCAAYNLSTKLTGAGGGGCAVTLVPDGMSFPQSASFPLHPHLFPDFSDDQLKSLINDLSTANFDPYITSVGGSGLGILSPYGRKPLETATPADGPITPPDTPSDQIDGGLSPKTLREHFVTIKTEELNQWADARGRWLFV